jgi:integrase/recombinase XerD
MPRLGALLLKRLGRRSPGLSNGSERKPSRRKPRERASGPRSSRNTPIRLPTVKKSETTPALDLARPTGALKESIEAFLLDQRSEHTRRAYSKDLKRFLRYWFDRKERTGVLTLDRGLVIGYKDFLLSEKLEHTTIDRHLASLRSFFRWLVEDGHLEKNPAENVRFLNPKRESKTRGFTDDEVNRVLALPDLYTRSGSLHYAMLMILFYCGLRRSELCDLRTTQIQTERGYRFFRLRGKGNSERIVVIRPPVWEAILHYTRMNRRNLNEDAPLLTPVRNNRSGQIRKPVDSSLVFYVVRKYARLAGIAHPVSPHSCRATAISNARDHNVPDRAIQEFAGWSTTTMITRYDKRKSSIERSAVHSIDYGGPERNLPDSLDPEKSPTR